MRARSAQNVLCFSGGGREETLPAKNLKYERAATAAVALLAVALACPARAAVVLKLELPQLVARSRHIVVATALGEISHWQSDGRIVTDTTLRVEQTLKGDFKAGQQVVVTSLGGSVGKLGMHVEGSPRFRRGRSAIVFLRELPERGELQVVGMSQGVIQIDGEAGQLVVIPGGDDLALVQRDANGELREAGQPAIQSGPLDDLLAEIRRLVAAESDGN